ncbi:MAG: ParB-like nuclease domain-containing protein [Pseudonocardiales bacterium]|nr:ParB-like nuclease domain-containing protein [Pseudonocardiales bacterium]
MQSGQQGSNGQLPKAKTQEVDARQRPGGLIGPELLAAEAATVRLDALTPPREGARVGGVVREHVQLLSRIDEPLPPILVHRETMSVIDGMHRVCAAKLKGIEEIQVRFFRGGLDEAYLLVIQSNITHGLPLTLAERKAAAFRILQSWPQWSDRSVAAQVGLDNKTIARLRVRSTEEAPRLTERVGRDGRTRLCDSSAGRESAAELLREQPEKSLREVARAAGISVSTVKDVRARLTRGEGPLPSGCRRRTSVSNEDNIQPVARLPLAQVGNDARRQGGVDPRRARAHSLRRDPSLRSSQAGRTFLRALDAHIHVETSWPEIASQLPQHCIDLIIELAQEYAQDWQQLAGQLARRKQSQTQENSEVINSEVIEL